MTDDTSPELRRFTVVARQTDPTVWEVDAFDKDDAAERCMVDGRQVTDPSPGRILEIDGVPQAPTSYPVSAQLGMGDHDEPYAVVTVGPATITAHSSTIVTDTVNIEVDGDFTGQPNKLRIHLNDTIVYDSTHQASQYFDADEIEAALRVLAELYENADDDTGDYLSERQQALAARVLHVLHRVTPLTSPTEEDQ